MTDLDEELTPQPIQGVDLRSLQGSPSPEDYFVLSRVDGSMTVAQLCLASGLGRQKTLSCLNRLLEFGLIRLPGAQTPAPTDGGPKTDDDQDQQLAAQIRERFPADFNTFSFNPELMAQLVELDDDFKKEILFVYEQLDQVNYYELLGTPQDAPRRELRRAYFQMSKRYHPDRFFRKLLGDFQSPMEAIFQQITTAYQTLSNRTKRRQYDAQLQTALSAAPPHRGLSIASSQVSEPREVASDERRREMAFQLLYRRGEEALRVENIPEAVRHFRKALSLKRDPQLALDITARLAAWPDHLDDAIAFARAAQRLATDSAQPLKALGEIYEKKGQIEDARYHFEQALKLSPLDGEAQQALNRLKN